MLIGALNRPDFLKLDVATLSGGRGQLLAPVRALLDPSPSVLLNEATASLDPDATRIAEAALDEGCRDERTDQLRTTGPGKARNVGGQRIATKLFSGRPAHRSGER